MSLLVREVHLTDFRNFRDRVVEPAEALTILVGHNAVGKTNTVEAMQLLTTGASFRHPRACELLRDGAEKGRAAARLAGDGRVIDVDLNLTPTKRAFRRNGKPCRAADLLGTLMSVLFCPDDLALVKGSASLRRQGIDSFGSQAHPGYDKVCRTYARAVEQRNSFLREPWCDPTLLDAWDESIALGAATLLTHRLSLFARLVPHVASVYADISSGETLECRYECSLGDEALGLDREGLRELAFERVRASREQDRRLGRTGVGPHRDDIRFLIDGRDARAFGSQGQQRSIVLAWKMAQVELAPELVGERPLLLLDDVMSELDADRREAILAYVERGVQTVVTTTNLGYFPGELLDKARVVDFGDQ